MTRTRLPDRRAAETVHLEHNGTRFMVTIGFYPDGRPGEVFTHGIRTGSSLDALLADACVVVSCLIQHGVEPRTLRPAWAGLATLSLPRSSAPSSIWSRLRAHPSSRLSRRPEHDLRTDAPRRRRHHRRARRGLRRRGGVDVGDRGTVVDHARPRRDARRRSCCA